MATRVGWIGRADGGLASVGESMGRVPIAVAAVDGSYLDTTYTRVAIDAHQAYWTINRDRLQLAANERPVRVTFSNYSGTGWVNDEALSNKYIKLSISSGDTLPENEIDLVTSEINGALQPTGPYPSADIPIETGKKLSGQKLSIVCRNAGNAPNTSLWGRIKVTIETVVHAINWTNPNLSFSQNGYQLTVTKSGSATDNWGEAVSYQLKVDGVNRGTFSGNSMTLTMTDADLGVAHTYKLVAVSSISSDGVTKTFAPAQVHKTVGYWNGTQWVEYIPHYWTGSAWQEAWPYYWDGTQWVLCSQT